MCNPPPFSLDPLLALARPRVLLPVAQDFVASGRRGTCGGPSASGHCTPPTCMMHARGCSSTSRTISVATRRHQPRRPRS